MNSYISTNANRFYVAVEAAFGRAAAVSDPNRYPAILFEAQQATEKLKRADKTGSRTFTGYAPNTRRSTAFQILTYLTSRSGSVTPSYGPLFQAAMGAAPVVSGESTVRQVVSQTTFQTASPHELQAGSAVCWNDEIRFVSSTADSSAVTLNAPFRNQLMTGVVLKSAVTYKLATDLPSLTLYDYWDPPSAVQRLITGATVDEMTIAVNGDFHEFRFRGPAADLVDSVSFTPGQGGLTQFPSEPEVSALNYAIVPGHLGQAWIGTGESELLTLTTARIELKNNLSLRNREFGSVLPRAVMPGLREVQIEFSLFAQDDAQSRALYQAARNRTPIPAMLQLGQAAGQLMGIYLPHVVPELPDYGAQDQRLEWEFKNCYAQGFLDDELYIAFA